MPLRPSFSIPTGAYTPHVGPGRLNVSSCVCLPLWSPYCTPAQDNVSSEGHAESTMQFLDSLGTLEFDFADLAGSGVLYKDVVTAMKAHSGG